MGSPEYAARYPRLSGPEDNDLDWHPLSGLRRQEFTQALLEGRPQEL